MDTYEASVEREIDELKAEVEKLQTQLGAAILLMEEVSAAGDMKTVVDKLKMVPIVLKEPEAAKLVVEREKYKEAVRRGGK